MTGLGMCRLYAVLLSLRQGLPRFALPGPLRLLAKFAGHGCPANRGREGVFFFGDFLLDKQKKVTG